MIPDQIGSDPSWPRGGNVALQCQHLLWSLQGARSVPQSVLWMIPSTSWQAVDGRDTAACPGLAVPSCRKHLSFPGSSAQLCPLLSSVPKSLRCLFPRELGPGRAEGHACPSCSHPCHGSRSRSPSRGWNISLHPLGTRNSPEFPNPAQARSHTHTAPFFQLQGSPFPGSDPLTPGTFLNPKTSRARPCCSRSQESHVPAAAPSPVPPPALSRGAEGREPCLRAVLSPS